MTKLVSEKLGVKPDTRAILINAPTDAVQDIKLPKLRKASRLAGEFDYIHFFARTQAQLDKKLPALKKHLKSTGMLWLSWPKAKQLNTDLSLLKVIKLGYDHGLVESKAMSINETWSASKFTHPKANVVYRNSFGKLNANSK